MIYIDAAGVAGKVNVSKRGTAIYKSARPLIAEGRTGYLPFERPCYKDRSSSISRAFLVVRTFPFRAFRARSEKKVLSPETR